MCGMSCLSVIHLHSGGFADAFIQRDLQPFIHTCIFIHIRRWCRQRRVTASLTGAVRVRCVAQGHLDTMLGGAGDQTSNLPVTSQPALPPELLSHFRLLPTIF